MTLWRYTVVALCPTGDEEVTGRRHYSHRSATRAIRRLCTSRDNFFCPLSVVKHFYTMSAIVSENVLNQYLGWDPA